MKIFDNLKNWLYDDDESEIEEERDDQDLDFQKDYQDGRNRKDIDSFIIVMKPFVFTDAQSVCDHIKQGRAVILNTENTAPEDKPRLIDFVSGVVMARDGMIAKIYQNVYLCSPENIGVIEE